MDRNHALLWRFHVSHGQWCMIDGIDGVISENHKS